MQEHLKIQAYADAFKKMHKNANPFWYDRDRLDVNK